MPDESRYLFNKLNKNLLNYWLPENLAESMLVEQLAFNYWRLKRAFRLETEFLYSTHKQADIANEIYKPAYDQDKSVSIEYLDFDKFDKFSRYIVQIQRSILRILHELERIQARRKGENVPMPTVVDVDIEHSER